MYTLDTEKTTYAKKPIFEELYFEDPDKSKIIDINLNWSGLNEQIEDETITEI